MFTLFASTAGATLIDHHIRLVVGHSDGRNYTMPTITVLIDNTLPGTPDHQGITNPTYEGATVEVSNPIYSAEAPSGSLESIETIRFEFGDLAHLHAEGIVHRDVAARNSLVTTTGGTFASAALEEIQFGNDGPLGALAPRPAAIDAP